MKRSEEMLFKLYKSLADLAGLEDCGLSKQHNSQPCRQLHKLEQTHFAMLLRFTNWDS